MPQKTFHYRGRWWNARTSSLTGVNFALCCREGTGVPCQKRGFFWFPLAAKFSKHQRCLLDQKGTYTIQNVTARSRIVLENTWHKTLKKNTAAEVTDVFSRNTSTFTILVLCFSSEQDNILFFYIYGNYFLLQTSQTFLTSSYLY